LLSLRPTLLFLALRTTAAGLWKAHRHLAALLPSTLPWILILRPADFPVANVFVTRKLKISDHSLLGFLLHRLRGTVEECRIG
jgi:hypothetical protein